MDEIIKRLEIIKLSMLIKDSDSINLQIKQLEVLNINQQIKNIIILTRNHNYYKAIKSIDAYPNNLYSNEYYNKITEEEEELIEQFDLFEDSGKSVDRIVIDKPSVEKIEDKEEILEELKKESQKITEEVVEEDKDIVEEPKIIANTWFVKTQKPEDEEESQNQEIDKEKIEEIEEIVKDEENLEEDTTEKELNSEDKELEEESKDEIIDENLELEKDLEIEENTSEILEDEIVEEKDKIEVEEDYNSWYANQQAEAGDIDPNGYNKDYTFDNKEMENNTYYGENFVLEEDELDDIAKDYYRQKMEEEKNGVKEEAEVLKTKEIRKEISKDKEEGKLYIYEPIELLEDKYQALIKKFSSLEINDIDSIKHIINIFVNKAYSDDDIVGALEQFNEFKANGDIEEAVKIILLIASTDSPLAQFSFARELFKGDVLEQNYDEAFILMSKLAIKNYPDAICDLGQFYEYGVGTKKDRKRALILYQEAIDLGLDRASELYEKLNNSKQGIFSYLFD